MISLKLVAFPRLKPTRVTFNAHILETGTRSYRLATSKTSAQRRHAD